MEDTPRPTLDDIKSWPATVDIGTAAAALGIGRSTAYDLARRSSLIPLLGGAAT